MIFAFAYNSNFQGGNPAVMGHSADEVAVNVSGNVMTLQQAIDNSVILNNNSGNLIPKGYSEQYVNFDEDAYTLIGESNYYDSSSDTCDSDINSAYQCSPAENRTCIDINNRPVTMGGLKGIIYSYGEYQVTCRRAMILVKNVDQPTGSFRFSFSGNVDSELLMSLQGKTYHELIETAHGNLPGNYNFINGGIPSDGIPLHLYNVSGRGTVAITQQPSSTNGYTVKVDIQDPQGSEGTYGFTLSY